MAMDFTVINPVRQRFGNKKEEDFDLMPEMDAPYVGTSKEFPFDCPNVDGTQSGILQFESLGIGANSSSRSISINGSDLFGGLRTNPWTFVGQALLHSWRPHFILVHENVLRENNVLKIESGNDDFVIDNLVIMFKVRSSGSLPGRFGSGKLDPTRL